MDPLAGLQCLTGLLPTKHWLQAGAEKLSLQRPFDVALDVDHGRRAGDKVFQARLGGASLQLLALDIADIEHEALQTALLTTSAHLPTQAIPAWVRRQVVVEQTQTQVQGAAVALQFP
ncbi:hypothetical protein D3C78_743130 [compost metagenome]